MSDGECATPGHRSEPRPDGGRPVMTLPASGSAPWERLQDPSLDSPDTAAGARRRAGSSRRARAEGMVTVADLIAKVGTPPTVSGRRHAAPDPDELPAPPEPRDLPKPEITVELEPWPEFDIDQVAYASELPDLDRIGRHDDPTPDPDHRAEVFDAEATTILPALHDGGPATAESSRKPRERRARHGALLAGRAVAAMLAVFALVVTGGAWQWSSTKNRSLNHVSALDMGSHDIVDAAGQYGDENFLIVGADTRAGANSDVGAGSTDDAEGARSDVVMLVNIPANRKRVVVVSFPRDLAITPLQCESWNPDTGAYGPIYDAETGGYGDELVYTGTKLNSTYAFGGPKCLVKEIQKLSGLAINRFVAVDFVGFGKVVDALGGVEVCSTSPLYDDQLGTVLDRGGRQVIDGATALNYVRARYVEAEGNGDYGRIKRQQLFLSSLLRSLISSHTFLSPTKLNNVVNTFIGDSYVDNVGTKDLVNLGQSLQKVAAGHITFVTVPTSETDENGDEVPRMNDVRALFDAIINDDPLPGENDTNATATPTTVSASPSTAAAGPSTTPPSTPAEPRSEQVHAVATAARNVTVRVSNATDESGLATSASTKFEQAGFNVAGADDYSGSVKATTVLYSPGNEQAAATVASALGNAPIQRIAGMGEVVRVVLGSDFHSVGRPAPSGSPVNVQLTRGASTQPTELPDDLTVTNAADTTCE